MSPMRHRSGRAANYDKAPYVPVGGANLCTEGWEAIGARLRKDGPRVYVVETYPGIRRADVERLAEACGCGSIEWVEDAFRGISEIAALIADDLTEDPVFGRLTQLELEAFFDSESLRNLRHRIATTNSVVMVAGVGALLVGDGDVRIYADMPRWEIQKRQRAGEIGNLGAGNAGARSAQLYKRAYFVDWRVADRHKRTAWEKIDYFLDTVDSHQPKLIDAMTIESALKDVAQRPFRIVPFFDPAPWGGQWMKDVCSLPPESPNYGWCFDCVPEENSLLLGFGKVRFEIPAIDLVFRCPKDLLGARTVERFGAEFPIRFDLLDTIEGGNLSVQVHPLREYMQANFGLPYTQDESYYLLDAEAGATVHLGVRSGVDPEEMFAALQRSARGVEPFAVERFVNRFPAKRHDHFLIPAGTVHGSGAGSMVLEISATPYIFTFKLYDWDRPGLDGRPRPLHLQRGRDNLRFERDTDFARRELINRIEPISSGSGWRSERTGLHTAEILETHRHWFTGVAPHPDMQTVQVLNLVAGEAAVVESPTDAFPPLEVHFAETFVVPAGAGSFHVRAVAAGMDPELATVKAFVRGAGGRNAG